MPESPKAIVVHLLKYKQEFILLYLVHTNVHLRHDLKNKTVLLSENVLCNS